MTFTVLVCGGRSYEDREKVNNALADLCDKRRLWTKVEGPYTVCFANMLRVVSGAASGADTFALEWAMMNGALFKGYRPEYNKYPGYAAPCIRNQTMLDSERVDLVLAFPGGAETRDMCNRARKAGIEVRSVK